MNNFQDYKLLSKEYKMDFLLAQWEMESPILKGIINVENEIAVIEDLKNYKNIELKNPFLENEIIKEIPVYFGEKSSLLKSNEKVFFYFKPIQGPQIEENLISVDLNHFDTVHEILEFSKKIAAINFSQEDMRFFDNYLEKREEYLIQIFDYFKPRFDEEFKKEKSEIEEKARVVKNLRSKEKDLSMKVSKAEEEHQKLEEEVNSLNDNKQTLSNDLFKLDTAKQSLEPEIKQLSRQSEEIKNEIMAFKQKKKELETTFYNLNQKVEKLKNKCEKKKNENERLEEIIQEHQDQLEILQKLGIRVEVNSNSSPTQYDFFDNDEALVNHTQQYLAGRKGNRLFYEKNIIKMFYSSLCTNQITVLSGNPGCGKSSLVEGFAGVF